MPTEDGLALVWATRASGSRLRSSVRRARELAGGLGGATLVIAATAAQPEPAEDGMVVVNARGAGLTAAFVLAAGKVPARRYLLLDDDIELDEAAVAAHREADPSAVAVGPLVGLPPRRSEPNASADPLVMFALGGGRNCSLPSTAVDFLDAGALDDAVPALQLAGRLAAAGVRFERVDAASARWSGSARTARRLGSAAAQLYSEAPSTLPTTGIGSYPAGRPQERVPRSVLRRLPAPVLALVASVLERSGRDAPAAIVDAFWWQGVRRALDRRVWKRLASGVCIVMLHAFTADDAASRYIMPARRLRRLLRLLRILRRRVVALDEYIELRRQHELPPPRTTVITIDDGYEDVYSLAAPLLRRYRLPATVFVVTGRVGAVNDWDADGPLRGRQLADWPRLQGGLSDGLTLGAHTRTHARLPATDDRTLSDEVSGSGDDLRQALGRSVPAFAYPYGEQDERATQAVAEAGFSVACSARPGLNGHGEPLLRLRRVEPWGDDPLWRHGAALVLGWRGL